MRWSIQKQGGVSQKQSQSSKVLLALKHKPLRDIKGSVSYFAPGLCQKLALPFPFPSKALLQMGGLPQELSCFLHVEAPRPPARRPPFSLPNTNNKQQPQIQILAVDSKQQLPRYDNRTINDCSSKRSHPLHTIQEYVHSVASRIGTTITDLIEGKNYIHTSFYSQK